MNLQIIKSTTGQNEYVLLPMPIYKALYKEISSYLAKDVAMQDYVPFKPEDFVDNPVALARIQAGLTQKELAQRIQVSQAYVSKLERQAQVSIKVLTKVKEAVLQPEN